MKTNKQILSWMVANHKLLAGGNFFGILKRFQADLIRYGAEDIDGEFTDIQVNEGEYLTEDGE